MSIGTRARGKGRRSRGSCGFTLVEIVLALGVTSFCLVALTGLLSVGLKSNLSANQESGANELLSAIVADLDATPAGTPRGSASTSPQFGIPIPANPVKSTSADSPLYFSSDFQPTTKASSLYLVTITALAPNNGSGNTATFMDVKVTWPGSANVSEAAGQVETFVALNRN